MLASFFKSPIKWFENSPVRVGIFHSVFLNLVKFIIIIVAIEIVLIVLFLVSFSNNYGTSLYPVTAYLLVI